MRYFLIFLFFFSFSTNKSGAEELLTWKDCVREAKENHPELVSSGEGINQAKASKEISASNLLPQFSSDLSKSTSGGSSQGETDTYSYGISGSQLLFDGFKTRYNVDAASENIKSAEYFLLVTSTNVRLRLRTAFVNLLRAQELLNLTEDISGRRKQNLELVKLRYEAGREHKGSLLTAQANLAQAEYEVLQAKRNISLAQVQLLKELGRTELTPIKVSGDFEIRYTARDKPDFEVLSDANPFLHELIAIKEVTRFGLKSARADFFPQVYASASAGSSASDWPPDTDSWSAGVKLSFPLFEGGRRTAEVDRNKANFKQAEADEKNGRSNVILTLEETWAEFQNAIDRVGVQMKFLEAGEERAKIAQAQYSTGLISFDNWTIIEDDLVRVKKSFLDTQANALVSEAGWIQAEGETLDYED